MACATLRFYEELNDFLAPALRKRAFTWRVAENATVKNLIESLGVPHTEVEIILVNGESVGFGHRVQDGDRVSVYPMFEAFDVTPLLRLRPAPLRDPRLLADAQLGGLARWLRMLGFDTAYDNQAADDVLRRRARAESRIILTRDRQLLVCRDVTHGCYVHAQEPKAQLREVVQRLQLASQVRPFTRCLRCNEPLQSVDKAVVLSELPPAVARGQAVFKRCPQCLRVYWHGDHVRRMSEALQGVLGANDDTGANPNVGV